MTTSKVRAVTIIKELLQFLGFTNFYCQFICNYSSIANLLTSLM